MKPYPWSRPSGAALVLGVVVAHGLVLYGLRVPSALAPVTPHVMRWELVYPPGARSVPLSPGGNPDAAPAPTGPADAESASAGTPTGAFRGVQSNSGAHPPAPLPGEVGRAAPESAATFALVSGMPFAVRVEGEETLAAWRFEPAAPEDEVLLSAALADLKSLTELNGGVDSPVTAEGWRCGWVQLSRSDQKVVATWRWVDSAQACQTLMESLPPLP
jgi:hypothetical protein